jgi:hypothetical protein
VGRACVRERESAASELRVRGVYVHCLGRNIHSKRKEAASELQIRQGTRIVLVEMIERLAELLHLLFRNVRAIADRDLHIYVPTNESAQRNCGGGFRYDIGVDDTTASSATYLVLD